MASGRQRHVDCPLHRRYSRSMRLSICEGVTDKDVFSLVQ
jgi:hypothetical protein